MRDSEARARRYLSETAKNWVANAVAEYEAAISRVPAVGIDLFRGHPVEQSNSNDYYRELIRDGYLDMAVLGGNSRSQETGRTYTWDGVEGIRKRLDEIGFERQRFLRATEPMLSEKVIELLGRQVRVRVHATGGSHKAHRIRRSVANFVEGLAHADVVIYSGHSNKQSGCYYLSESKSRYSRFRIGLGKQEDLAGKCHGLCSKNYQLISLHSCFSFDKYCRPIESYLQKQTGRRPGLLGTWRESYFKDFLPRTVVLIELLLEGRGARDIFESVDATRPFRLTPPLQMRGLLQARDTFIVPAGVTIEEVTIEGRSKAHRVSGRGSDGRQYCSTEVFAQNAQGDVVQVLPHPKGVVALYRDGAIYYCGVETGGAMQELPASTKSSAKMRFIGWAEARPGKRRLYAIDEGGAVHVLRRDALYFESKKLGGAGALQLVAIANDAAGRLIGVSATAGYHVYENDTWTAVAGPLTLRELAPTLSAPAACDAVAGLRGELVFYRERRSPQ